MYLYELALELGERSTDLAERAAQMGFVGIGPSSTLTAEQVAALRGQGRVEQPGALTFGAGNPVPPPPPPIGAGQFGTPPPPPGFGGGQFGVAVPPPPGPYQLGPRSPKKGLLIAAGVIGGIALLCLAAVFFLGTTSDDETAGGRSPGRSGVAPEVVDPSGYCAGAKRILQLELGLLGNADKGYEAVQDTVASQRDGWRSGVDLMEASTEGGLKADIGRYRTIYQLMFDEFMAAGSDQELAGTRVLEGSSQAMLDRAATNINAATTKVCS